MEEHIPLIIFLSAGKQFEHGAGLSEGLLVPQFFYLHPTPTM